jgi:hypothetical protein
MPWQMDLFATVGSQQFHLSFVDDGAEYVDMEIRSESKPLAAQRHSVSRDAIMRRFKTGADPTIDEIVRQYLSGAA